MEKINNVIDQLVGIYSERGFLNDEMISKVAFENGVSALMIDKIIEVLDKKGIMISNFDDVVQDSYTVQEKTKKSIIKERADKYHKQQKELIGLTEDEVKEMFYKDISSARMQSTYMPLVVLSYFEQADEYGIVSLDSIVESFQEYYSNRRKNGEIVERKDSIFVKSMPSDNDVKRLILFNPLGRSCLVKYFLYDREHNTISLIDNLWNSLHIADVKKIKQIAERLIEKYYDKLT